MVSESLRASLNKDGFAVVPSVLTNEEMEQLRTLIAETDGKGPAFRKTSDLFAVRRFLEVVPGVRQVLAQSGLKSLVETVGGSDFFLVKSIYFDKPEESNWFVSYHQDLTISVTRKEEVEGYGPWTVKPGQFGVQPPLPVLEEAFTIRIHLDDTDEANGALRVIPGSHRKGIYRSEEIDWTIEKEVVCSVPAGGAMLMKPLLLHASNRTSNGRRRRVIHLEWNRIALPEPLKWAEYRNLNG